MIYVMSDIHGCYNAYRNMLAKINLKDEDNLYVLGDVIDYGDESIELLQDMMMRANVFPIIGDHELTALMMMKKTVSGSMDAKAMEKCKLWLKNGGMKTLQAFNELDDEQKEDIIDYLEEFSLYEEVVVKKTGKEFLLVHAGLENFDKDRDIDEYDITELLFESPDYDKLYFDNKTLVTGHKRTENDKIYNLNNHLAIDCGCGFGGRLACVRLDDMKEFYVDAK